MINNIKTIYKALSPQCRKGFIVLTVLSLISPVIDIYSVSKLLSVLNKMAAAGTDSRSIRTLVALGLLVLFKGLFDLVLVKIQSAWSSRSKKELSCEMFTLLTEEDLLSHNSHSINKSIALVRNDVDTCVSVLNTIKNLLINIIMFVGFTAVMLIASPLPGLICIGVTLICIFIGFIVNRKRISVYGERQRLVSIVLYGLITVSYKAYKEIKNDKRKYNIIDRFRESSEEYAEIQRKYSVLSSLMSVIMQSFLQSAVFFAIVLIAVFSFEITSILPAAIMLITLLLKILPVAGSILNNSNSIIYAEKSCEVFCESHNKYTEIVKSRENREDVRRKDLTFEKGLHIEGLTFAYPGCETLYEDACLDVPVGKTVAVIGPSGSGKTTLLDIIVGHLKAQGGKIMFDDYDIVSETDAEGKCSAYLGDIISYIPQFVGVNSMTVTENVTFMSNENVDMDRVIECLKCAKIYETALKMPDGLDTQLGDFGYDVSGGERQRIGLARALYKKFELLVMDEATAALDIETEAAVIDSIREMKKGKTLLIVTHHLSLARECDIVYKIENKKLVRTTLD